MPVQKAKTEKFTADVAGKDDWGLICVLCCPAYTPFLPAEKMNKIYAAIYAQNDAYGARGTIPPQGYDWSGIRDSSKEAQDRMALVARAMLDAWGKTEISYAKTTY